MGFQQGLSGLNVTAKNLEVIGHNIANANTYGNKASRAEFADMYATAMNGSGTNNIGIGVTLAAVSQQFTQGNITATDNPLDMAINGSGFFQMKDASGETLYTRNGQFKVDKSGFVVNNEGQRLMGYPADGQGVIQPGLAKPLQLPTAGIQPHSTSKVSMELNLDARVKSTEQPAGAAAIDFSDPTTYNNATSVVVYDGKGQEVALTYYFQKGTVTTDTSTTPPTTTGGDTWNIYVTVNGQPLAGTPELPERQLQVVFDANGSNPVFTPAPVAPSTNPSIDIPASVNGAGSPTLAMPGIELDLSKMTQYGANFGVTDMAQDGYAPGQLTGVTVDDSGIIMARYSNGQSKPAGQIEIANFRNVQGLQPVGGNMWQRSFASGDPVVGVPGDGNLGSLRAGSLEESNVDLTGELVNMITAQRIYQANAQTIKAEDQLMQTIVNLR